MDWAAVIISFLQPLALKCWEQISTEDPQAFLKANYDTMTGRMDPDVVDDAIPVTRRAVIRARKSASRSERKSFPRLSRQDLYNLAEQGLVKAMNASTPEVESARLMAAEMSDED